MIRDPAERQIAVECFVVISRISDRNPEIQINSNALDLMRVIQDAISQFWTKWVHEQSSTNLFAALALSSSGVLENPGKPIAFPEDISSTQRNVSTDVTTAQNVDTSFEKNDRLARRLFFDLPQEGKDGTMSYLAKSCVRNCFDVSWAGDQEFIESVDLEVRGRPKEQVP